MPEGDAVVLFFGRVTPNKGVHLVLEAAERAASRATRPLRVRIVGSSEYAAAGALSPYEVDLRARAAAMSVPVDFVPFLPPEDVTAELGRASVACLPSTWSEGFPLVALEAMANGLPVVCSDSPGMVEACGDAAAVVPMGEVEGLADAVVDLAADGEHWAEMSERGRSRAQAFTWERTARALAGQPDPTDGVQVPT